MIKQGDYQAEKSTGDNNLLAGPPNGRPGDPPPLVIIEDEEPDQGERKPTSRIRRRCRANRRGG
eukprot:5235307-Alexandrium_andersonii.AAC.1